MKIITINLAEPHVKALQILQDLGLYPSRSEAIRVAIRDFLQRKIGIAPKIDEADAVLTNTKKVDSATQAAEQRKEIVRLLKKLRQEQPELSTVA